jgi:outer membrane protein assembly factor BamB
MRKSLACALFITGVFALRSAAEDWPSWRGPRGDGSWRAPPLPERWPAAGLKPLWKVPVGAGYTGIAVSAGRLYTLDREKMADAPKGGPDGHERVLCLDAATGQALWSHRYPCTYGGLGGYANGPRARPSVHDGRVYTLGAVGHLFCFDARTGDILWRKDMVAEHQARVPEWGFAASPVIDGEKVIVHTGAEPDGSLIAFDRLTGKEIWRSLTDPAGYCTPILINAKSGRQLITWTPENIHGLDPADGKRLWSVPYKVTYGVSITTPIFRDDIVFVTGYWQGSKAIRLGAKPTDAELIWEDNRNLRGLMAQPLYRDGVVYSMDKQQGLVAFELKDGTKLWDDHRLTPKGRNPHASIVSVDDGGRVLILNADGELILARLTPQGYEEQSRTKLLNGKVWGHPAFAGKSIFAKSDGAERPHNSGPFELMCVPLVE